MWTILTMRSRLTINSRKHYSREFHDYVTTWQRDSVATWQRDNVTSWQCDSVTAWQRDSVWQLDKFLMWQEVDKRHIWQFEDNSEEKKKQIYRSATRSRLKMKITERNTWLMKLQRTHGPCLSNNCQRTYPVFWDTSHWRRLLHQVCIMDTKFHQNRSADTQHKRS